MRRRSLIFPRFVSRELLRSFFSAGLSLLLVLIASFNASAISLATFSFLVLDPPKNSELPTKISLKRSRYTAVSAICCVAKGAARIS